MYTILHDLNIKAEPPQIYKAITSPYHLNNWWTLRSKGIPLLDTIYSLYFDPAYDWRVSVSKAISNSIFELTMTSCGEGWESTCFGFKFNKQDSKTDAEFYHKDCLTQDHHYPRIRYCWAILLKGINEYEKKEP